MRALALLMLAVPAFAAPAPPSFEAQVGLAFEGVHRVTHNEGLLERFNHALAHLVEDSRPSVVKVLVKNPDGPEVVGTGFFVGDLVLTNHHVIEDAGNGKLSLRLSGGQTVAAEVVSSNARKDVAILKTAATRPPLLLGSSARIRGGHMVVALGHPRGLPFTVSLGVVSSERPTLDGMFVRFVQSDAAVNPGNSGGPLLAMDGTVIGMNTLILSDSGGFEGLSFSVPSETLQRLIAQYRRLGHIRPGWLGVNITTGAVVAVLPPGSPAKGKVELGDRIVGVGGKAVPAENASAEALIDVSDYAPGDRLQLEVVRKGKRVAVHVVLGEFPAGGK